MLHQIKLLIILMYLPKQSHSPQKLRYNLIEYCFPNLEFKKNENIVNYQYIALLSQFRMKRVHLIREYTKKIPNYFF